MMIMFESCEVSCDVYISNYHEIDTNSQKFYVEKLVL